MKEFPIRSGFNGIGIKAYSPLIESFNEVLYLTAPNGLAQKFVNDYINPKGLSEKEDEIGAQVLTMDDLEAAFLICCFPLALSVVAFIGEFVFFWMTR